ncbi:MAG: hypothetical protein J7L25_05515 [Deltaproteobacteria bacterium]|nr:hypothetical protein [Candidatus Tharpella aukensis]
MTHLDTGNYAAKHSDPTIPEELKQKVLKVAENRRLSCTKAHQLALETSCSPAEVGRAADLLEIRLSGCQLGLFGQSREKNITEAKYPPSQELQEALTSALKDQSLPCLEAWRIADRFKLKKTEITTACETLKIKISPCQLGAF